MRVSAAWSLVALALALARPVSAECAHTTGMLVLYQGTIGSDPVRATFAFGSASVSARVSAGPAFTDVLLRGVQLGRELVMNTPPTTQTPTLRARRPNCSTIEGYWRATRRGRMRRLSLHQDGQVGGTLAHRYDAAGVTNDTLVDSRVRAFRLAIIAGNERAVSYYIAYPLRVNSSKQSVIIANRAQLLTNYSEIFTAAVRSAITRAVPADLFARDQGVMLGSGVAWFNATGKAISINQP